MAWHAELKRRHWYRIHGFDFNPVIWYSDKLYQEWWNSLTKEQQEEITAKRKRQEERERQEAMNSIAMLYAVTAAYDPHGYWR